MYNQIPKRKSKSLIDQLHLKKNLLFYHRKLNFYVIFKIPGDIHILNAGYISGHVTGIGTGFSSIKINKIKFLVEMVARKLSFQDKCLENI